MVRLLYNTTFSRLNCITLPTTLNNRQRSQVSVSLSQISDGRAVVSLCVLRQTFVGFYATLTRCIGCRHVLRLYLSKQSGRYCRAPHATDLIQVLSGMIEINEWTTTDRTTTDVMVGGTELNVCKEATSLFRY